MYMNLFAAFMLIAWLPVIVLVFNALPPKKAIANLFVFAWLFLPTGGFSLPGVPDYTKTTATIVGVLACAFAFDQQSLYSFRFRWFDIPIVTWCAVAFLSAMSNGSGAYEGASAMLGEVVAWGLPYLIGRIYLQDAEGAEELARAMIVGGLCYIPFCLLEIRLSPMLAAQVYGIHRWEGERFGGYRPKVFLATSLETSTWMANAALTSYVLWSSRTLKAIRGLSAGKIALGSFVMSVLCKSTGALILLVVFVSAHWITRKTRRWVLIWALMWIPTVYCTLRTLNLWSGQDVVEIAKVTVGEDRAQSFEFRLNMERLLADHALERPLLGWGRITAGFVLNSAGKATTIPDGWWILALGVQGVIGLACMLAMFFLPMLRVVRSYPLARWGEPQVGPVVALGLMLTLTMIDYLSNAMFNPIYAMAIGGLIGHTPARGEASEAEEALAVASELTAEGRMSEAGEEFLRAIELSHGEGEGEGEGGGPTRVRARAYAGLGHALLAAGRPGDSASAFREALALRDEVAAAHPDDDAFADLATAREDLSRALVEAGSPADAAEAAEERRHALQIWDVLTANHPGDVEYLERRADALNDLAWLLATEPGAGDPASALALAEDSVRSLPDRDSSWNTLGVARYRAGDLAGAIEALERSALTGPDARGTAFDHYFLSMAWAQLGRHDLAGEWLERGIAWSSRHRPGHPALERFRREAEATAQDR